MLNASPVRRESIGPKRFRPAPVRLRRRIEGDANRSGRSWWRSAVVLGIAVGLAVATLLPLWSGGVQRAMAVVQGGTAAVSVGARDTWRRHLRTTAVADELAGLQYRHQRARVELQALRGRDSERRRLIHLLQMTEGTGLRGVGGRVIARGGGGRDTLRLDAGTERGVAPGMAVVSAAGVVGQVVDAGVGWSDVLCVTDPDHGLSGVLQTGHHGTLRGSRHGLVMDHVLARTEVTVGTPVVTSGEGGVFPAGIPVGVVSSVAPARGTAFLDIEVAPVAPPELLHEVLIVTGQRQQAEIAYR